MMQIGDQILAPEEGWKRYDNLDANISYFGSGWADDPSYTPYNGSRKHTTASTDHAIRFNFTGANLRIVGIFSSNWSNEVKISVDGVSEAFSQCGDPVICQILNYQKLGMNDGEHSVEITNTHPGYWGLDAIDIDKDGELKPYNPDVKPEPTPDPEKFKTLLRVIMIDSSARDYQLDKETINKFIDWYNNHAVTDTSSYVLTKKVGTQESKEYLTFDKIISFEVIDL